MHIYISIWTDERPDLASQALDITQEAARYLIERLSRAGLKVKDSSIFEVQAELKGKVKGGEK